MATPADVVKDTGPDVEDGKPDASTALLGDSDRCDTGAVGLFSVQEMFKLALFASDHTKDYFFKGKCADPRQLVYSWIPFTLGALAGAGAAISTGGMAAVPAFYFTFTTVNGATYETGKEVAKRYDLPGVGYFDNTESFSERAGKVCRPGTSSSSE